MTDKIDLADQGAETALATGSMIREAPQRYNRAFGETPGAEPSQDNTDMALVQATLKLIGRSVEQIEITRGHQAILINDDGNRATVQIDVEDVSPEAFQPKLERALQAIPERYPLAEVAKAMQIDLQSEAEEMTRVEPRPALVGQRIERGGLE